MADRRKLLREKKVQLPQFARDATVQPESFDADANTVDIVWTTGASVRRFDWWDGAEYDEVLSVDPKSVRLERLNLGAPFLDTHCSYALDNVIGSVVPGTAKIEGGRGLATILLSRAPGVADTVQKIREGVIRNISVGYWIHKVEKTEADNGTVARWDVVDWEPLEISAVPIPADPGSQVRSGDRSGTDTKDDKGPTLRSCVLVTKKSPAAAPVSAKATKETRMAPRTAARTAAPKNAKEAMKRLADLEAENKRLAGLLDKRDSDDKKDDEESDDERDGDDTDSKKDDEGSDDERDGDDSDDKKDDEESDDERDGDDADEEDDCEDKDEGRSGKGKRSLTDAEVRKAAEKAVRADRVRQAKIREIGGQFGFPKLADRHAGRETSVRDFKDLVLEKLAERQKKAGRTTFAVAGTPEIGDETRVANNGPTAQSRAFDKGAAAAKALLGK